jgi:hypothetical protein
MAFRNASLPALPTANTLVTLYTCPAAYEAVVHALYVSNVSGGAAITVDVKVSIKNLGSTTTTVSLLKAAQIIYGTSLIFDKPVNLRAGDYIQVQSNTANAAEVNASILLSAVDATVPGNV